LGQIFAAALSALSALPARPDSPASDDLDADPQRHGCGIHVAL